MNPGEMMPALPLEIRKDAVLADPENPRSIINIVPDAVAHHMARLPADYLNCTEPELLAKFKDRKFTPGPHEERIRFMFWREHESAQLQNRNMTMANVYTGICTRDSFYLFLQNKEKLAWMLCPTVDYQIATEEALIYGLEQLRKILSMSHETLAGNLDPKAAKVKLDIVAMLDMRVKGAVIQTTRNLNVNVNENKPVDPTKGTPRMEDLDARLKELEHSAITLSQPARSPIIEDAEVISEPGPTAKN